jgi:hypothetical protein
MTTKRNIKHGIQDTLHYPSTGMMMFRYPPDKAVMNIRIAMNGEHPTWPPQLGNMLRQTHRSVGQHLNATSKDVSEKRRHNMIRRLFLRGQKRSENRIFTVNCKYNLHNGYCTFRPVNKEMTESIYEMLSCLRILHHVEHEQNISEGLIRFSKWIEEEYKLRLGM